MISLSSQAPHKSAKTECMNKRLICIDFAPPQKESFFCPEGLESKAFFSTNKIEQKGQQQLLIWLSRGEISKLVLFVILV